MVSRHCKKKIERDRMVIESFIAEENLMNKKVIVDKLQNEKAAKECGGRVEIGKEYELPLKGKCVIHSDYYQLENNKGKMLLGETGFPVGYAHDADGNKYMVCLDKTGLVIYLQVSERSNSTDLFGGKERII